MVIVVFRSRLAPAAGEDYAEMAREMVERARAMPGFVDIRSYGADDGERLSLIWWEDEATLAAWREDVRHRLAQAASVASSSHQISERRSPSSAP